MKRKNILKRDYYKIPLREKVLIFSLRFIIITVYSLRYKLRAIIPSRFKSMRDVFVHYFTKYEFPLIRKFLDVKTNDAVAAMQILTYYHTLTGVVGEIKEMTPTRAVREETHCPIADKVSKDFCSNTLSFPTFCAICELINPKIKHTHETYLSGGDDTCRLVFELEEE